ncbi:hypothetical protein L7F22_060516, partial [Adiantum nelumboides]|nr:hypothetical protein [Adiantum nelumboides]
MIERSNENNNLEGFKEMLSRCTIDVARKSNLNRGRVTKYYAGFIPFLNVNLDDRRDTGEEAKSNHFSVIGEELEQQPSGTMCVFEGVQLPEGALPLNMLPTIPIGDCHYVMLNDIMELFDLREDYCLAIVAQNLQKDCSTIDPNDDKYSIMDAHVKMGVTMGEFFKSIEALTMIFRDAAACAPMLPTESEFRELVVYDDKLIPCPRGQ